MTREENRKDAKDSKEGEEVNGRRETQKSHNRKRKLLATSGTQGAQRQAAELAFYSGSCASCG